MSQPRKFKELETAIGYQFRDLKLIAEALTHSSVRAGRSGQVDNERLEFLGDRVLGLAVAELLHARYPQLREGELARRFNRMVSGVACAQIARDIDLGKHVILAESEADSGGRNKDTILADAMEAILGAIFVEKGFIKAQKVVCHLWRDRLDALGATPVDPKSALQEWAQGRGLPLPLYREAGRSGPDHAPQFIAEVNIKSFSPALAEGSSKRHAEQAAARRFLMRESVWKDENND